MNIRRSGKALESTDTLKYNIAGLYHIPIHDVVSELIKNINIVKEKFAPIESLIKINEATIHSNITRSFYLPFYHLSFTKPVLTVEFDIFYYSGINVERKRCIVTTIDNPIEHDKLFDDRMFCTEVYNSKLSMHRCRETEHNSIDKTLRHAAEKGLATLIRSLVSKQICNNINAKDNQARLKECMEFFQCIELIDSHITADKNKEHNNDQA